MKDYLIEVAATACFAAWFLGSVALGVDALVNSRYWEGAIAIVLVICGLPMIA